MDATQAADALGEIEALRIATRRSLAYRLASAKLILWGAIVAVADFMTYAVPVHDGRIWLAMTAVGVIGSGILGRRMARNGYGPVWRIFAGFALFFAFGAFWSIGIGHFDGRQMLAFWPTLVMFGYCLAGLWLGRVYIILGLAVAALVAVGYFALGPAYPLYLAVVNGGGLIVCGLWMRQA